MTRKTHENLALHARDGHLHLPRRERLWRGARRFALLVLALLALGAARIVLDRLSARAALESQVAESQKIYVKTVTPTRTRNSGVLTLPATLRGDNETTIYARVNGYVRDWRVDIGAHVKKGELLAELETPELDQQVAQATAEREKAKANVVLAKAALARWKRLFAQNSVARQDLDQHQNAYDTAVAALAGAQANLRQLQETMAFKKVVAPYDGVISKRDVDIGSLINAGASGAALFSLVKTDPLRVAFDLPQAYSQDIKLGDKVSVTQAELPNQIFTGVVSHIAGAIDVTTRSQKVELTLKNPDGRLTPGAYVSVSLPLAPKAPLSIPANCLLFRAQGPQVAVVDPSGRAHLRDVVIAADLGVTLEISKGVAAGDRIIVNPPDSLAEGDKVTVVN